MTEASVEAEKNSPAPSTGWWKRGPFARSLGHFPAVRKRWLKGVACALPASLIDVAAIPLVIRAILNGITAEEPMPLSEVGILCGAILVLGLLKGAAKFGMRFWITGASREFERRFRDNLFSHLTSLTPHDLSKVRTGDIMSRSIADLEAVRMLLGPSVMYLLSALIIVPTAVILMFVIDSDLALIMLGPFLFLAVIVKVAARPTQRWSETLQERLATLSTVAQENVSGIRVVKAFAAEARRGSDFRAMGEAFLDANVKLATLRGFTSAAIAIVKDLGVLAILLVGGWHLVQGDIALGDFVLFLDVLGRSLWPLIAIGWMLGLYTRAKTGAQRLEELFSIKPTVTDDQAEKNLEVTACSLRVKELSYRWNGSPTLKEVSFTLPAGKILGITGRTGCGKSTLIQLLSRQIEPPPKTVFLDDHDIVHLPLSRLRDSLAVVPQDTFLFSETIYDNIAFGRDEASSKDVEHAATAAQIHHEIAEFPEGYKTLLGERGITLSGGQRQRVAIARALAVDTPLLLLDDCLSAVDTATERAILTGLSDALKGRTAILVSHRVAALSLADRILVLDEGAVVEEGTHEDLLAEGGLYAAIEERQRIEEEIEEL
ncbi:MAG: ABC transporter ATP-binding protein [Planctomycetota bacterium]|nr:ABC transporter ATP-binding protein [Planctomycetota bacterium]